VHRREKAALEPKQAVVLYEGAGEHFAMVHRIAYDGANHRLGAGKPMSSAALRALNRKLQAARHGRGLLPESVLAIDDGALVWYEPPQMRTLAFSMSTQFPGRSIGARSGRGPCPGVVFVAGRSTWAVFAFKGKDRPQAGTRLHRAPFFNVSADGSICAGTVRRPESQAVSAIGQWSDAFWRSYFSHANYTGVVKHPGDVGGLWKDLLAKAGKRFPEATLIDAGLTVGSLIDSLEL
jgi:PRTRC genetic system protein B